MEPLTDEQKATAAKMWEEGRSIAQIAHELGVHADLLMYLATQSAGRILTGISIKPRMTR